MQAPALPDYMKPAIEAHADEFLKRANGVGFIQFTITDAASFFSHYFNKWAWNYYRTYLVDTNGPFQ